MSSSKHANSSMGAGTPAGAVENLAVPAAVVVLLAVGIAAAVEAVEAADSLGFVVAAAAGR